MDFKDLKYTQDSVAPCFNDGSALKSGRHINEPIKYTTYEGVHYIVNNRTAVAKQMSGAKRTCVTFIPYEQCKVEFHRKKTGNGDMPRIRPEKGYHSKYDDDFIFFG